MTSSITAAGGLETPYYRSSSGFLPLTYHLRSLDFAIAFGATVEESGVNWVPYSSGFGISTDTVGLTLLEPEISSTVIGGAGTITVSGHFIINDQKIGVEHIYTLLPNSYFLQVETTFRNLSTSGLNNLRYWVGTRDDWIGESDNPSKERGNIVNGVFVANTTEKQATALKLQSESEVLFFYADSGLSSRLKYTNITLRT